jgi:hypothetical protein
MEAGLIVLINKSGIVNVSTFWQIKNSAGRSPIYEAQAYNHDKVAEFFLSAMVEENDESAGAEEEQDVVEQGPSSGSGTSQVTANEQ